MGSAVILGDRDVDVTLQHLAEALSKTNFKRLLTAESKFAKSLPLPEDASDAAQLAGFVESVKTRENVKKLMGEFREGAPKIYEALVSERDEYMAMGLANLDRFPTTVAVMGLAHVDGVESKLLAMGWQPKLTCSLVK